MSNLTVEQKQNPPKTFNELAMIHMPRPIHDKSEYDNAAEIVDWLMLIDGLNDEQEDYLEAVVMMIAVWDTENVHIDTSAVTGLSALKFILDNNGYNASSL